MSIFKMGPDGWLFVYGLIVSTTLALLSRRHANLRLAAVATLALALAFVIVGGFLLDAADPIRQIVRASFVVVPSVMLLGMSRVAWLARRAWLLVLIGPVTFGGCYAGICELCVRAHLI